MIAIAATGDREDRIAAVGSMIGSFDLQYQVVAVDSDTGRAIVAFHARNFWDTKSLTRLPWVDKATGGPAGGPTSGPLSRLEQHFYWSEVIEF